MYANLPAGTVTSLFTDIEGSTLQWRTRSILYFLVPDIGAAYETPSSRGVIFSGAPHMI